MERLRPWLLPMAVYGGLIAVTALMVRPGWLGTPQVIVIGALQLLYAGATVTFGPWRSLLLAVVPATWIGDLALFMEADAFDCYPGCTGYQDALGFGLTVLAAAYVVVVAVAIWHVARHHGGRGRHHAG